MSVFIEVWHRTHPLTEEAHRRFVDYYAEWVVGANPELLDVVGGWRTCDGETNTDLALYRYASLSEIERTMAAFGADPAYLEATDTLFRDLSIEEHRAISFSLPYCPDERLEQAIARSGPRGYLRCARRLPATRRNETHDALERLARAREEACGERLFLATEYMIGDVMQLTEWWQLEDPAAGFARVPSGLDPALVAAADALAPESSVQRLEPLAFSRLG